MATRSAKIDQKADLIWAIADKLTGVYKPHEYGDVILPLTVIRRFDCILSDTKDAVLQKYDEVKNLPMKDILLRKASKKDFYNTSKYTFERLMDDPDHIEENFREYLNKFSANVRDILEKFKFDGHITTMANKGILYIVLKEYTTDRGNLHPNEISNLEMGYIFEEIIRRFSESHNEDAGQHYTPREVIQLMVNILFYDDNDILSGNNVAKTIYDPACGTGGMLSVAEEYLHSLNASTELVSFGQEINDQTFAICKADMLIKGNNADYIKDGNTLSDDQFAGSTFDYILSNPPFGREWKNEKAKVEEEAKLGFGGRFGAGLPATSDGQMLFLMTAISKMKDIDKGGSRIAIIHNGSPLFTGDAGSGPSEIRRYILENDLLEAIIALPNDIFYNTGIATYIWVLSNKKAGTVREGKVQLINANEMFVKRRKALGNKRNDISKEDIAEITKIYGDFKESEISQIYDDEDFGYTKITVERPLRDEEGKGFIAHIDKLRSYLDAPEEIHLGRKPEDLLETLVNMVLGSPAICIYRSNGRSTARATSLAKVFVNNFNLPESTAIIDLAYGRCRDDNSHWQNVLKYCKDGCFQAMIDEYIHMLKETAGFQSDGNQYQIVHDMMMDSLKIHTATYIADTYPDFKKRINGADRKSDGCRIRSSYAVGFTKDAGDNSKVVMRKENIRNAFNSPMRPFVLATTSIGQEGLDFHNYCRVIMHWNLPSNPIDVGRILRTFKIKKNVEVTDNGKIII